MRVSFRLLTLLYAHNGIRFDSVAWHWLWVEYVQQGDDGLGLAVIALAIAVLRLGNHAALLTPNSIFSANLYGDAVEDYHL